MRRLTKRSILVVVSCFGAIAGSLSAQAPQPQTSLSTTTLQKSHREVTLEKDDLAGPTYTIFTHGYIVRFIHTALIAQPNIVIFSSSGQVARRIAVWPVGSSRVFITSVDCSSKGDVVFSGKATKANGVSTPFIGVIGAGDSEPAYVFTGAYLATAIAVAGDGSLWTIGAEHYTLSGDKRTWNNYDTMRHYSVKGSIIEHFLPRWGPDTAYVVLENSAATTKLIAFNRQNTRIAAYAQPNWGPSAGYVHAAQRSRATFLRTVGQYTVLYDGDQDMLCVHDSSVGALNCTKMPAAHMDSLVFTGFAVLNNGAIYASLSTKGSEPMRRLFELTKDATTDIPIWTAVDHSAGRGTVGFHQLLGSDGADLVYRFRRQAYGKPLLLEWSHP